MKNEKTAIWILFLMLISPALLSMLYFDVLQHKIRKLRFLYEDGEITTSAPFGPNSKALFGVNGNADQMLDVVFYSYRITLISLIIIGTVVLIISVLIGTLLAMSRRQNKIIPVLSVFTEPFFFIPQAIMAYILLYPMIYEPIEGFKTSLYFRIFYYMTVLMFLMIPTTVGLIKERTALEMKEEYILSARIMSSSNLYIYYRHLLPNLKMDYIIIFLRMMMQSLIIMAHIAFFKIFFAGTDVCYGPACLYIEQPLIPELSTLLGHHFDEIGSRWWTFYFPLAALMYMLILIQLLNLKLQKSMKIKS